MDHSSGIERACLEKQVLQLTFMVSSWAGFPSKHTHPWLSPRQNTAPGLPELEHMLLLFVIDRYFADCILQTDGDLVVVRDARSSSFRVLVEAHLLVVYDTVHIMP